MGLVTGTDDDSLLNVVEVPKHTNPIGDEIVLTPEINEHVIISKELLENKRPWYQDISKDMYKASQTEISGIKEYVEYFSMMVVDNSISSGDSAAISDVHRQVVHIKDYPIFLEGDGINTSTDAIEQKTDTASEGTIVGVLPPQTSDYFVLTTGINRRSVFRVTSSKPLSIYDERGYAITYIMEEEDRGVLYNLLMGRVVRTLNYIRENHQLGVKYLLTDSEVNDAMEDRMQSKLLFETYKAEFYNNDLKVFTVNTKFGWHTDMILQGFLQIVQTCPDDIYAFSEYDETKTLDTIFDVLLYLQPSRMFNMMEKVYYYLLRSNTDIASIQPILISPIATMPFQKGSRMMAVKKPNVFSSTVHDRGTVTLRELTIKEIFAEVTISKTKEFPNVLRNETYLLSEQFYSGGSSNLLEELIRDAINGRNISRVQVGKLISQLTHLEREERFFLTPFVIALVLILQGVG